MGSPAKSTHGISHSGRSQQRWNLWLFVVCLHPSIVHPFIFVLLLFDACFQGKNKIFIKVIFHSMVLSMVICHVNYSIRVSRTPLNSKTEQQRNHNEQDVKHHRVYGLVFSASSSFSVYSHSFWNDPLCFLCCEVCFPSQKPIFCYECSALSPTGLVCCFCRNPNIQDSYRDRRWWYVCVYRSLDKRNMRL